MNVYNNKKFWSGIGIVTLSVLFAAQNLFSPPSAPFQGRWNLILAAILAVFGITGCARALSRGRSRQDRIEEADERNRQIRLAGKAKALDIMRAVSLLVTILSMAAFKKTGDPLFAGIALWATFSVTAALFVELTAQMYYEEKNQSVPVPRFPAAKIQGRGAVERAVRPRVAAVQAHSSRR